MLAQAECALKKKCLKLGQNIVVFMFTFELCMLLEGFLKIITLRGFFLGIFKIIKIFGFLAQTQPS